MHFGRSSVKGRILRPAPPTKTMAVLILVVLSIPLGYSLLLAGTENDIYKYGKHFSTVQFMLSPDRGNYLGKGSLAARYAVVHMLLVMGICATQLTAMKLIEAFQKMRRKTLNNAC